MLEAALDYCSRGWPVVPLHSWTGSSCTCSSPNCSSPAKHPRTAHGLKDATDELSQVGSWWKRWPQANVGLVTGLGFDALDIDGPDGWESLARAVEAHGCLPSGPCSMTPGGGAHYLFQATGLGCRIGFRASLDWKGKGGYIVAPPSVHSSGGLYEWALEPESTPLEPAPAWLVAMLDKQRTQFIASTETRRPGPRDPHAYGQAALERECGCVAIAPVGQRNAALNKAAFVIGQLIAGRAIEDPTLAVQTLLDIGRTVGLGDEEVYATVKSGIEAGTRQPRRTPRSLAS
jgi:hypothetical protein